jgi:sortase A
VTWTDATFYRLYATYEVAHAAAPAPPLRRWRPLAATPAADRDALIGVLSIPRVGLSTAVVEGDDDRALRIAAGHLPDTPLPWEAGNSALAGHRDMFFGALAGVREGDEVSLATRHGTLRYRVVSVTVVGPDDVSMLGGDGGTDLTLITCYPFGYLGPAPRRFVVLAKRVAFS